MKIAVLATGIALAFTIGASASPWNKKTNLDVKETILIPGKELPPGKYVMKLADSQSNRHIVQIFNADESKVEATILAIPNWRLKPTGDTAFGYWETPAGVPPALRSWFYPGDNFGQEFAYPKVIAERLAAANKTTVPWYEGEETASYEASKLRETDVHDVGEAPPASSVHTESKTEPSVKAEQTPNVETESKSEPTVTAEQTPSVESPERSTVAAKPADPAVMAQNRPQEAPAPRAQEAAPRAQEESRTPDTLPQTATPYGVLLLGGIGLLAAGRILAARLT